MSEQSRNVTGYSKIEMSRSFLGVWGPGKVVCLNRLRIDVDDDVGESTEAGSEMRGRFHGDVLHAFAIDSKSASERWAKRLFVGSHPVDVHFDGRPLNRIGLPTAVAPRIYRIAEIGSPSQILKGRPWRS